MLILKRCGSKRYVFSCRKRVWKSTFGIRDLIKKLCEIREITKKKGGSGHKKNFPALPASVTHKVKVVFAPTLVLPPVYSPSSTYRHELTISLLYRTLCIKSCLTLAFHIEASHVLVRFEAFPRILSAEHRQENFLTDICLNEETASHTDPYFTKITFTYFPQLHLFYAAVEMLSELLTLKTAPKALC